jgi:hypothetical protein
VLAFCNWDAVLCQHINSYLPWEDLIVLLRRVDKTQNDQVAPPSHYTNMTKHTSATLAQNVSTSQRTSLTGKNMSLPSIMNSEAISAWSVLTCPQRCIEARELWHRIALPGITLSPPRVTYIWRMSEQIGKNHSTVVFASKFIIMLKSETTLSTSVSTISQGTMMMGRRSLTGNPFVH